IINLEGDAAPLRKELVDAVAAVLKSGNEEGLAVLLPLLADLDAGSAWTREAEIEAALLKLVESRAEKPLYPDVLLAAASFPKVLQSPLSRERVIGSLRSRSLDVRRAAVQVLLNRFTGEPSLAAEVDKSLAGFDSGLRGLLISELAAPARPRYRGRAASAV